MGGFGLNQAEASTNSGGAHVLAAGGDFVLDSCSVADDGESNPDARSSRCMKNAAKWWLFGVQSVALRNS